MGSERNLSVVPPILFTADGGTEGQITLATTLGLFVKQNVVLQAPLVPPLNVQVKFVINDTQILVGPQSSSLNHRTDVSAYTVAAGSFLFAAAQPKATLPNEERLYASYVQEPINAWRTLPVDSFGNSFDSTNPLPVSFDGTISIGEVEVKGPSGNFLDPNSDGSVKTVQLFTKPYDSAIATYPSPTQEVYTTYTGGLGGTVVQVVTVNYTDYTKNFLLNFVRV